MTRGEEESIKRSSIGGMQKVQGVVMSSGSELTGATGMDCLGFGFTHYPPIHPPLCIHNIFDHAGPPFRQSGKSSSALYIVMLPPRVCADQLHCSRAIPVNHRPKRNFTSPGRPYLIITSSRAPFHTQFVYRLYRVLY